MQLKIKLLIKFILMTKAENVLNYLAKSAGAGLSFCLL
ncbi:hypothetical protein PARC_a0784 [Pseudoalteromonas arctica A 37-1-2]|uniref:Uncharacterized protein n=1 Tax=Pseudoalteromonas arctica A 37-1-2 TaxID=1117313 RepID=A0A290S1A4_9GAMM|nr:hypothetical protein PARC_a0784 [Pseudoalteromonas arctica A 37-1-2]